MKFGVASHFGIGLTLSVPAANGGLPATGNPRETWVTEGERTRATGPTSVATSQQVLV